MYILSGKQMQSADRYTIATTPVHSIDLMERAAKACVDSLILSITKTAPIKLVCGPGNNGGDGLVIARMLHQSGFNVCCFLFNPSGKLSTDNNTNLSRLKAIHGAELIEVTDGESIPEFQSTDIVIDALFGTGLSKNVNGIYGQAVEAMNDSGARIYSIDLPSGIYSDETSLIDDNHIVKAYKTLTFQFLKPALLVAENAPYFGTVEVLDIGVKVDPDIASEVCTFWVDRQMINDIFHPRKPFTHKGSFGHGLIVAGGLGKMGAAILAAKGYLKSGGGLLTMMVPKEGADIIQTGVPEAMCLSFEDASSIPQNKFNSIGIGPGMGTETEAQKVFNNILDSSPGNLIVDADALNIISNNHSLLKKLPANTILTPHPGEFKRLAGDWHNDFEKLEMQKIMAVEFQIIIILKGKNTSVACPDGTMYFNSTGNPGMAKGGSGDILTGIITGLLASGYSHQHAAIMGVYLHGLAGDIAAETLTQEAMNAGDIIDALPNAWKHIAG